MHDTSMNSSAFDRSPLVAAYAGSTDFLIPYLQAGGPVSHSDEHRNTLLHAAADGWQASIVELLILSGADVNAQNLDGDTPLHVVSRRQQPPSNGQFLAENSYDARGATFRQLLLRRADQNSQNIQGATPLHIASWAGDLFAVTALATPANIDQTTSKGATSLALAILNGHVECARLLIQLGACVTTKLSNERRPIDMLRQSDRPEMRALAEL